MKTVQQMVSPDGTRKVEIFQRDDGSFGFSDWKYSADEDCWFPSGRYSESFADSLETALREATGRIRWLADPRA